MDHLTHHPAGSVLAINTRFGGMLVAMAALLDEDASFERRALARFIFRKTRHDAFQPLLLRPPDSGWPEDFILALLETLEPLDPADETDHPNAWRGHEEVLPHLALIPP